MRKEVTTWLDPLWVLARGVLDPRMQLSAVPRLPPCLPPFPLSPSPLPPGTWGSQSLWPPSPVGTVRRAVPPPPLPRLALHQPSCLLSWGLLSWF